jgi:hypothetical protein
LSKARSTLHGIPNRAMSPTRFAPRIALLIVGMRNDLAKAMNLSISPGGASP